MANEILAALPLSRNDVSSFANLIDETLKFYCTNYSALEREYLLALRTVVGLGFTAALVCESLTHVCEPHLFVFLKGRSYKKYRNELPHFALAAAEIINWGLYFFKIIRHPKYYEDFVTALKQMSQQMKLLLDDRSEEINRLMKLIFC